MQQQEYTFEWEIREENIPYGKHMIAGCVAGMIEHSTMFPFDNIKTHAQVTKNVGFFQIIRQLYNEGGIPAFYRGIGLMACGSMPAHAAYFSVYEFSRFKLGINDEKHHPYLFALTGSIAVFLHDLVLTPIDVIKQRKQITNKPAYYLLKSVIQKEGITQLIRSFPVTYLMNAPMAGILVSTNETLKLQINQQNHNFLTYFACAGIAGAVAATLTTPLDVIKTKLQTQDCYERYNCNKCEYGTNNNNNNNNNNVQINKSKIINSSGQTIYNFSNKQFEQINSECKKVKYNGFLQTLKLVWQNEGVNGLFRGFGARIIIFAPSSAISWATYEVMKKFLIQNPNY